jgi:competence protein CoiA
MLVAAHDGKPIEADRARRGLAYICPNPDCARPLILKQGRIRIAHFAHKPPTDCSWANGETLAHLEAKKRLSDAFSARGLRTEVEFVVPALPNDRRADVMVWSPGGKLAAIELQHCSIGLEELERRAFSYANEGIAQAWVPFLSASALAAALPREGGYGGDLFIERYSARPFERWAHAFQFGELWFYEPAQGAFWRGRFDRHEIWQEGVAWYTAEGEEMHAGGYYRTSRQWKELTLWGPYAPERIRLRLAARRAWQTPRYRLPQCRIVRFLATADSGAGGQTV